MRNRLNRKPWLHAVEFLQSATWGSLTRWTQADSGAISESRAGLPRAKLGWLSWESLFTAAPHLAAHRRPPRFAWRN